MLFLLIINELNNSFLFRAAKLQILSLPTKLSAKKLFSGDGIILEGA
jgi:hypothetical protein